MMGSESGVERLWKHGSQSLLQLYMLKSFGEGRKSGYDMMREIKGKTDGKWVPSKGAVYPLIARLEKGGLLKVVESGPRGVKKYSLTPAGKKELDELPQQTARMFERSGYMSKLMDSIYSGMDEEALELVLKLKYLIMMKLVDKGVPNEKVKGIMRKAAEALEAL